MKNNTLASLIKGYEFCDGQREKSFFCRKFSGKVSRKSAKFFSPLKSLTNALAYTKLRNYGILFLLFGLLTIFIQFAKSSLGASGTDAYGALIVGASFSLIAATLLIFDKPLSEGLQEWAVTDFILFDFLRIKKSVTKSERTMNAPTAAFIGILLAALGYFIPARTVALAIGATIYLAVAIASPEFSLFTTLLVLPITPIFEFDRTILAVLIAICALSFTRKVLTGKRVYSFEQYDLVILLMLFFMLISGIFLGGMSSFINSMFSLALALGYFAASNIITNRRLYECALTAISLSSLPISVMTAVEFIKASVSSDISLTEYEITATFTSGGTLSAFLTVAAICSYLLFKYFERGRAGMIFAVLLLLDIIAIILATRVDAITAILISAILITAASKNKKALYLTIIIYILLHFVYFIPENAIISLAEKTGLNPTAVTERAAATAASAKLLVENLLFGVGIGEAPFSQAISDIAGVSYKSSGNLLLQLGCEGGIFVPMLFLILMLIRSAHVYKYLPYAHKSVTSASLTMSGAVYSLLLLGIFENVFADPAIYCLFFVVFGIGSAMLRASKTEHDERLGYFTDTLSMQSSSVDIDVD